ncbi:MAG TPA: aminotransferase [Pseudonocardiaceae bacterium]|nr:aminotransferase [Pseudonocardiaceae bacterium]
MRPNSRTTQQIDSPISTTYALLDQRTSDRPLLDLAQAAPAYPPAPEVADHIADVAHRPDGNRYVGIFGLPALRETFAAELSAAYAGHVEPEHVLVTAGCNQAFCLTVSALAAPGDEVIMPLPFYFNHDMWLRLEGIRPVYLEPGPGLVPDVADAAALITDRTKAIVLVTPANPSGVTLSPDTLSAFAALAAERDIALIVDETYRTFRGTDEPAHALFANAGWADAVVSLHSFSKDLAIPGYRVGAVVGAPWLTREIAKLLDCVAICAPRIGQEAVLAGLLKAGEWRRARALEVVDKQGVFAAAMAGRPGGFELVTSGAYFGWLRHPFPDRSTEDVVRDLLLRHDALTIPGTAFLPEDRRMLRVSIANASRDEITEFASRLSEPAGRYAG